MKVALVVGHTRKSKGALNKLVDLREFDFYSEVVKEFENYSNYEIFYHNEKISGYTSRIKATAKELNKQAFDVVIALHFNSFTKESANGCTTLYYGNSKRSENYAHRFSNVVSRLTGIKQRSNGAHALLNTNDRGFAMVYYPKAPTILIEPFFGSNIEDCKRFDVCAAIQCIKEFENFL